MVRSYSTYPALILLFIIGVFASSCGNDVEQTQELSQGSVAKVFDKAMKEAFLTERNEADHVDSPAIWHGADNQHWLITTACSSNRLVVHDAITGEFIKSIGGSGSGEAQFRQPNGISIVDNIAVVIESGNKRAQVFQLPDFTPLGFFGKSQLRQPYGICMYRLMEDRYYVYITDNYKTSDSRVPPDAELNTRVHKYEMNYSEGDFRTKYMKSFGDTEGPGVLKSVEAIHIDPLNNRLLIADKDPAQNNIKVYDSDGNFTGTIIDDDLFSSRPEGMALYSCEGEKGYWILTDQSATENRFHVLDRQSLEILGSFKGEITKNTHGICVTTESFGVFNKGAFYAINDNNNIACYSCSDILKDLNLEGKYAQSTAMK